MTTLAAVLVELGQPLELQELTVPELLPGQVLVELTYSGVCHTQLLEVRGLRGPDPWLPHTLGHEGSGVVTAVGPGVSRVAPGDPVILSWLQGPGANTRGPQYRRGEQLVNAGPVATFTRLAVVSENRLTPLPGGLDPADAALLGCAAPTGLGAVLKVLRPRPGDRLAVFGCGGVGLCAVLAAHLAGCAAVVAVDVRPAALALATRCGASATVDASAQDPVLALASLLPAGLDHAVEATGQPTVMAQALAAVRPRGGQTVVVGNARAGAELVLDPRQFNQGKRLLGTWGGDTAPEVDLPRYAGLIAAGRLDLAPLRQHVYRLEQINEALDDLAEGRAVRPLIDFRAAG
ncbi:MAG: zinc-binding dehydrogenase [Fimbriimonadaceae bacterium]|nr:zinc-binding dehydrogenase [Fimbriimonadaceae bacterium]